MIKNLFIFPSFFLISFFLFGNNIDIFFAQDDFILIHKFSQNTLFADLKNIFSYSETHFRPIHNFYFFILGNIFGKNYIFYHLTSLVIHTLSGLMVFVLAKKILKSQFAPFVAAFFYLVNSSHFVSLYWISGNAVEIGFLFFCISVFFWVSRRFGSALIFLFMAIFASEAYLVGPIVYFAYEFTNDKKIQNKLWLFRTSLLVLLAGIVRLIYLTPKDIYDTYKLEFSLKVFSAIKYYLLRIGGFSELPGDALVSLILLIFWAIIIKRFIDLELDLRKVGFSLSLVFLGLFPFILLPNHLSPHYMNLSIFGVSLIVALTLAEARRSNYILLLTFLILSAINVSQLGNNHWVVIKSRIAEAYIRQIEESEPATPSGSKLVFNNNRISSSLDAYLALGGGKAIDFWFPDKNYTYCFSEFESCDALP